MHAQLLGHMPHPRLRISVAVALAAELVLLAWWAPTMAVAALTRRLPGGGVSTVEPSWRTVGVSGGLIGGRAGDMGRRVRT
jgi:hypothetical protein